MRSRSLGSKIAWLALGAVLVCAGCDGTGAVPATAVSAEIVRGSEWRAIEPRACEEAEVSTFAHAEGAPELVVGLDAVGRPRCIDTLDARTTRLSTPELLSPDVTRPADPEPQPMIFLRR